MDYQPDICIFHSPCLDGFTAAWAIHRRWPGCDFVPANYDQPIDIDVAGKHVLMVDFSFPAEQLTHMAEGDGKAASVVVIDHHKTAQAGLIQFDQANSANHLRYILDNGPEVITVWFDMHKSGARMAWEFAHSNPPPDLVLMVEDRDLWRFAIPETAAVCAALATKRQSFAEWDQLMFHTGTLEREGQIILAANEVLTKELCEEAYVGDMAGHDGVVFLNVPGKLASDCGHELLTRFPDAPFVATWSRQAEGAVKFSLRSTDLRVDVSEVAKKFGGGGHRNAAGFNMIVTRMPPEHAAI